MITKAVHPFVLREKLRAYLIVHGLMLDVHFWTPGEWKDKGETMCETASLHVTMEGPLMTLANDSDEELRQFLEGLGYYYELGFQWSMHLYPDSIHTDPRDN